jgi:single-stranded DNA-binding protein
LPVNSFTVIAIGTLAREAELLGKGNAICARFCLVADDYLCDEDGTRPIVTAMWFVAFGSIGLEIATSARQGDQLIVEAQVRANNWGERDLHRQCGYCFVVQGFRFGARRAPPGSPITQTCNRPPNAPLNAAAEASAEPAD